MEQAPTPEPNRLSPPGAARTRKARVRGASAPGARLPLVSPPKLNVPIALLEEHAANHELRSVAFEYFNPNAKEVFLAGSFNDWQPRATPLTAQRGGKWSTTLLLSPGQHEYRFVVDGQWQDDPMATRFIANPYGTLNAACEVRSIQ